MVPSIHDLSKVQIYIKFEPNAMSAVEPINY